MVGRDGNNIEVLYRCAVPLDTIFCRRIAGARGLGQSPAHTDRNRPLPRQARIDLADQLNETRVLIASLPCEIKWIDWA